MKFTSEIKKIFFNFAYINKTKKINNDFLNEIKKICNYSLRNLIQGSRQSCGYSNIETNKSRLPPKIPLELVNYVKSHFNKDIEQDIKKYDYLRVGDKERIYGVLVNNIFFAIIFDPDKYYQNNN
ncbi:hypothetical protein M1770_08640 [Spiroplasma citri]|uniref:hypothetical protein n=1 Tax=Spiroplasma citri TaxID=2133 RepID=UPI002412B614|nr:hypothetical protein [Spiroplasma citri]WFG98104.1 hypothetical protein M1770_08640 [Spiroplasma citri]